MKKQTVKWGSGAAAAGMLVALAAASAPASAGQAEQDLPDLKADTTYTIDITEGKAAVTIDGKVHKLGDFEGEATIKTEKGDCSGLPAEPCPLKLRVVDIHLASTIGGKQGDIGQVRIEDLRESADPAELDTAEPDIAIFSEYDQGAAEIQGPVEWRTAGGLQALELAGPETGLNFPPQNEPYSIAKPVELYEPGQTEPIGTLDSFEVIVNHTV